MWLWLKDHLLSPFLNKSINLQIFESYEVCVYVCVAEGGGVNINEAVGLKVLYIIKISKSNIKVIKQSKK